MNGFDGRNVSHDRFRIALIEEFRRVGCAVTSYGVERDPEFARILRDCGGDPTALFLRFQPDEALVVKTLRRAYLCEVKSSPTYLKTGNLSYQLASHAVAVRLSSIGVSVFVAFANFTAAWPTDIVFSRKVTDGGALGDIHHGGRGSGTPYGLFPANAPFLKPLGQFAEEELGCRSTASLRVR